MLNNLTTAHLADGCLRIGVTPRCVSLRSVLPGVRVTGRAVPVQHFGSVDVFLEALEDAPPGAILVIDNAGRRDEACIGDLVALEAQRAGIAAIAIWGCHRDTEEIRKLGMPVYSLDAIPTGPMRLDSRTDDALVSAQISSFGVTRDDMVAADDDGVLFMPASRLEEIAQAAARIRDTEQRQATAAQAGKTLRSQFHFTEYLKARAEEPALTLRQHLANLGGAIEV